MSPGQKNRPSWDVCPPGPRGTRSPHELRYPHPTDKDTEASTASPASRTPQLEGDGAQIQGVGLRNLLPNPGTPSHPGSSSLAWDLWAPLGVTGWATRPHSLLAEHHTYILRGEDPKHFGEAHALTEETSYTPHFAERLRCGSGLGAPQPARRSPSYRPVHTSIATQCGALHCSARSTHGKVSGPTYGPPGTPPRRPALIREDSGAGAPEAPSHPQPRSGEVGRSPGPPRPGGFHLLGTSRGRRLLGSSPLRCARGRAQVRLHGLGPLRRGHRPTLPAPCSPGGPSGGLHLAAAGAGHACAFADARTFVFRSRVPGSRIAAPPDRPGGADISVAFRRASPHAHPQLPTSPATFNLSQAGGWGRNLRFKI